MADAPKAHESLSTEVRRMPVQGTWADSAGTFALNMPATAHSMSLVLRIIQYYAYLHMIIHRRKERWQFWFVVELGILALIQFIL